MLIFGKAGLRSFQRGAGPTPRYVNSDWRAQMQACSTVIPIRGGSTLPGPCLKGPGVSPRHLPRRGNRACPRHARATPSQQFPIARATPAACPRQCPVTPGNGTVKPVGRRHPAVHDSVG
eukprot:gene11145-biopygen12384